MQHLNIELLPSKCSATLFEILVQVSLSIEVKFSLSIKSLLSKSIIVFLLHENSL